MTAPLNIEVWSDIACPFCYIGDALLLQALDSFSPKLPFKIRYRSFELMPELPAESDMNATELLVRMKGMSPAQAAALNRQVEARAAEVGLEYHLDRVRVANTRAAHRLSQFALGEGLQHALIQRIFRAYFTEGQNVGRHDVLTDLAAEVGLARDRALEVLESDAFDTEVRADQQQARQLGIRGVPFSVINGKYAVSGAQPLEVFQKTLRAAWEAAQAP